MAHWISQNRSIARHPLVREAARLAGAEIHSGDPGKWTRAESGSGVFIGWGYKASGSWAMEQARKHGASFRLFEDGFVRSLKPGYGSGGLYSLVEDTTGIYYDGTGNSDLIRLLNGEPFADGGRLEEARADLGRYRESGASKYNWFPAEFEADAVDRLMPEPGVLVVDQTSGDASIRHGGLETADFEKMLAAALEDNPGKPVYLRGHPDHLFRGKRSCLRTPLAGDARVRRIPAGLAPWQILERSERVYVGTSLLGIEALLHETPVVTFGCPFYAGWGLSDDRNRSLPAREQTRSLLELFHGAFRRYPRYFDPDTREPCSLSRILDHLSLQKERFRENAGSSIGFGMSPWKRPLMNRYLASPGRRPRQTRFRGKAERWIRENPDTRLLLWGRNDPGRLPENAPAAVRVEDGFLRSAGLGAEFHTPLSLIFDRTGIYYDSTRPSDLESILQNRDFPPEEIREAEKLIEIILSESLTKYNLDAESGTSAGWPDDRAGIRILVPGQVERDASIQWGSHRWRTNADLLREVRRRNPDGVIAYKPHPDVVKRLRPGRALPGEIEDLCDVVVTGLDIVPWLENCDELHTLTSLSGFEALLRGKKVVCYGSPFYAGWGLTEDLDPVERRTRRRTLEELVAASLILYPRYVNPGTGEFTTAFGAAKLIARRGAPVFSRPWYLRLIASGKTLLRRR